jgi:hypothetical protein
MSQALTEISTALSPGKPFPRATQGQTVNSGRTKRRAIGEQQRKKLSVAQLAYVGNDPRWIEHRRKLAAAQEARRMTLMDNEVTAIVELRKKGRTFSYIAEEIGVCRDVIRRELVALGIPTAPVKADRRVRRGRGFWRSFD